MEQSSNHSSTSSAQSPSHRHTSFLQLLKAFAGQNDGQSLVEFACTLPLILLIMTGIFSFSGILYQRLTICEAASVGGRTLASDRGDNDPCRTASNAIYAAAPTLARSSMTLTFVLNGVSTTGTTCPGTSGAANPNLVSGGNAQVTVSYPVSLGIFGRNISSMQIASQITEVVQ